MKDYGLVMTFGHNDIHHWHCGVMYPSIFGIQSQSSCLAAIFMSSFTRRGLSRDMTVATDSAGANGPAHCGDFLRAGWCRSPAHSQPWFGLVRRLDRQSTCRSAASVVLHLRACPQTEQERGHYIHRTSTCKNTKNAACYLGALELWSQQDLWRSTHLLAGQGLRMDMCIQMASTSSTLNKMFCSALLAVCILFSASSVLKLGRVSPKGWPPVPCMRCHCCSCASPENLQTPHRCFLTCCILQSS